MAKRLFSIVGDSISTFAECNPEGFSVYYEGERCDATGVLAREDTWWARVVEQFEGEVLANASYSGSLVEGAGFPAGSSAERIAALARDGAVPDTVIVFMGINDYGWGGADAQAAGRGSAIPRCVDLAHRAPRTPRLAKDDAIARFEDAYDLLLSQLRAAYPAAEVWCCTLCPGRVAGSAVPTFAYRLRGLPFDGYNDAIRSSARRNGCRIVDVRAQGRDYEALDGTHPTARGMAQLAELIIRSVGMLSGADGHAPSDGEQGRVPTEGESPAAEEGENARVADAGESDPGVWPGGAEAWASSERCCEASCIGCPDAASTNATWLLVCRR